MWTGRRFRLGKILRAIEKTGDFEDRVAIPAGEIVQVLRGPYARPTRLVNLRWVNRELQAFAGDLETCREQTRDGPFEGG